MHGCSAQCHTDVGWSWGRPQDMGSTVGVGVPHPPRACSLSCSVVPWPQTPGETSGLWLHQQGLLQLAPN